MKKGERASSRKRTPIEQIFREEAGREMTPKERRVLLLMLKKRKKLPKPK